MFLPVPPISPPGVSFGVPGVAMAISSVQVRTVSPGKRVGGETSRSGPPPTPCSPGETHEDRRRPMAGGRIPDRKVRPSTDMDRQGDAARPFWHFIERSAASD